MGLVKKLTISVAITSSLLLVGCSDNSSTANVKSKVISEDELGYGSVTLNDDAVKAPPSIKYTDKQPGESKKIKRSFQDAPPLIPHSVEGMLPITQNNNQCITCHVDSAPYDKTIPSVPVSHFTNFRPSSSYALKGEITSSLDKVSIRKENRLIPARFNCSQCHVPQANVKPLVDNHFQAEYTSKDGAFKSSWDDTKFMEGIDTTK